MFDVAAESYDRFMGRFASPLAPAFADFAGVKAGQRVLLDPTPTSGWP